MRIVKEPTYKKYIIGKIERFDDRNTAFSIGAIHGDKYSVMHDNSLSNIAKGRPGRNIIDHATWVAGRTIDYITRRAHLGRAMKPAYNSQYRLKNPDPKEMSKIVKDNLALVSPWRLTRD